MKIMYNKSFNKQYSLYFHLGYWLFFIIFYTLLRSSVVAYSGLLNVFYSVLIDLPLMVILTYLLSEVLVPWHFYAQKKIVPFVLIVILISVANPIISFLKNTFIIEKYIFKSGSPYNLGNYLEELMYYIFTAAPVTGFKFYQMIRREMIHHKQVESDKLQAELKLREAELKLLKGQIQPHFLFNTLNNLYSLSIDKSDEIPDLILRLNSMLRYILYDCNSEKVSMVNEIDFINSYLELQQLRYDSAAFKLDIEGDPGDLVIAPMILQTFIDNSIKHGNIGYEGNPWIKIYVGIKEKILQFNISNTKDPGRSNNSKGIGISNVLKRLSLIYPGRHEIDIMDSESKFSVSLTINL